MTSAMSFHVRLLGLDGRGLALAGGDLQLANASDGRSVITRAGRAAVTGTGAGGLRRSRRRHCDSFGFWSQRKSAGAQIEERTRDL